MNPFLGQILMFGGNFAPRGWALCDGQILPIAQNQALFSILGTTYGGDGRTTFALPDLRGRLPVHAGKGNGLTDRRLGSKDGTETNRITVAQMASHNHSVSVDVKMKALADAGTTDDPSGTYPASNDQGDFSYSPTADSDMGALNVTASMLNNGGGQPVNNMMPYQCVNYIIALQGTFPSRN